MKKDVEWEPGAVLRLELLELQACFCGSALYWSEDPFVLVHDGAPPCETFAALDAGAFLKKLRQHYEALGVPLNNPETMKRGEP